MLLLLNLTSHCQLDNLDGLTIRIVGLQVTLLISIDLFCFYFAGGGGIQRVCMGITS